MAPMPTIFSRIITNELPGTFVWRDETCVGFLSIHPLAPGHTLVVPVVEVVDVLLVLVDAVVVVGVLTVFLDFGDFVEVSALASVVVVGFVDGPFTGFADAPFADGPCVVVEGP